MRGLPAVELQSLSWLAARTAGGCREASETQAPPRLAVIFDSLGGRELQVPRRCGSGIVDIASSQPLLGQLGGSVWHLSPSEE